jgi:PadR family transcriptional regulator PadR
MFILLFSVYNDLRYVREGTYCIPAQQEYRKGRSMNNLKKEIQSKLTKGLLDIIVLQLLDSKPMHGYQMITKIRRSFGVYFGPSTIYPLLASLEKKGCVISQWDMKHERPRKVFSLTERGKNLLNFTESSLNLIYMNLAKSQEAEVEVLDTGKSSVVSCQNRSASALASHSQ